MSDGFAAPSIRAGVADHRPDLAHRVVSLEQQHHHPAAPPRLWVRSEVVQDVIPDELLDAAVLGVVGGENGFGVAFYQFQAGGEHPGTDHLQTCAGD